MSIIINEKSSFCLKITLEDVEGDPLSPIDEVDWWVALARSDTPVWPKQSAAPVPEQTIVVPAEANICQTDASEQRFVVVRAKSGTHVKHDIYPYTVNHIFTVPYQT